MFAQGNMQRIMQQGNPQAPGQGQQRATMQSLQALIQVYPKLYSQVFYWQYHVGLRFLVSVGNQGFNFQALNI